VKDLHQAFRDWLHAKQNTAECELLRAEIRAVVRTDLECEKAIECARYLSMHTGNGTREALDKVRKILLNGTDPWQLSDTLKTLFPAEVAR
jgi:hypothetical protein